MFLKSWAIPQAKVQKLLSLLSLSIFSSAPLREMISSWEIAKVIIFPVLFLSGDSYKAISSTLLLGRPVCRCQTEWNI
jgi:hypothetical protein